MQRLSAYTYSRTLLLRTAYGEYAIDSYSARVLLVINPCTCARDKVIGCVIVVVVAKIDADDRCTGVCALGTLV